MYKVTVQVSKPSLGWDQTDKVEHVFNNWKDVSTFAYRLALQMSREIRVEHMDNGYYYRPSHADNFLGVKFK